MVYKIIIKNAIFINLILNLLTNKGKLLFLHFYRDFHLGGVSGLSLKLSSVSAQDSELPLRG